jgi:hypothetical protein
MNEYFIFSFIFRQAIFKSSTFGRVCDYLIMDFFYVIFKMQSHCEQCTFTFLSQVF